MGDGDITFSAKRSTHAVTHTVDAVNIGGGDIVFIAKGQTNAGHSGHSGGEDQQCELNPHSE